jgi:hypothetical protein
MRAGLDVFVVKMECRDDGEKSTASDASVNKVKWPYPAYTDVIQKGVGGVTSVIIQFKAFCNPTGLVDGDSGIKITPGTAATPSNRRGIAVAPPWLATDHGAVQLRDTLRSYNPTPRPPRPLPPRTTMAASTTASQAELNAERVPLGWRDQCSA